MIGEPDQKQQAISNQLQEQDNKLELAPAKPYSSNQKEDGGLNPNPYPAGSKNSDNDDESTSTSSSTIATQDLLTATNTNSRAASISGSQGQAQEGQCQCHRLRLHIDIDDEPNQTDEVATATATATPFNDDNVMNHIELTTKTNIVTGSVSINEDDSLNLSHLRKCASNENQKNDPSSYYKSQFQLLQLNRSSRHVNLHQEEEQKGALLTNQNKSFEALEKCIEWLSYHPENNNKVLSNPEHSLRKEMTKRELVDYRQVAVRQWVDTLPESLNNSNNENDASETETTTTAVTAVANSFTNYPNLQELQRLQGIAGKDIEATSKGNVINKCQSQNWNPNNLINHDKKSVQRKSAKTEIQATNGNSVKTAEASPFIHTTQKQFIPDLDQILQSSNNNLQKHPHQQLLEELTEFEEQQLFQNLLENSNINDDDDDDDDDSNTLLSTPRNKLPNKKSRIQNITLWMSKMPIIGKCWAKLLLNKVDENLLNSHNVPPTHLTIPLSDPHPPHHDDDHPLINIGIGMETTVKEKDNDESDANINIPVPSSQRNEEPNPFLTIDIEGKDNETVRKELNEIIRNMRIAGKLNDSGVTLSDNENENNECEYSEKNSHSENDMDSYQDQDDDQANNTDNNKTNQQKRKRLRKTKSQDALLNRNKSTNKSSRSGNRHRNININPISRDRNRNRKGDCGSEIEMATTPSVSATTAGRATESNSEEIQRLTNFLLNTRKSTMRTIFSLRKERIPPETPAPPNLLNRVGRQVQEFFTNTIHGYFRGGTSGLMKRVHRINPISNHFNDISTEAAITPSVTSSNLQHQHQHQQNRSHPNRPLELNNHLQLLVGSSAEQQHPTTRKSRGSLLKKLLGLRKQIANPISISQKSRTMMTMTAEAEVVGAVSVPSHLIPAPVTVQAADVEAVEGTNSAANTLRLQNLALATITPVDVDLGLDSEEKNKFPDSETNNRSEDSLNRNNNIDALDSEDNVGVALNNSNSELRHSGSSSTPTPDE